MERPCIFALTATLLLLLAAAACTGAAPSMENVTPTPQIAGMSGMDSAGPAAPPVKGYAEGRQILFIHTEASDPQVAKMLTDMMDSPVLVVPSLAQAPETVLANVYVFMNGVQGDGPFGFQPDVFDRPPPHPDYSPLRAVHLIRWEDSAAARELRSAEEVKAAEANGQVTIERSGAVVNMPLLTWPGGQR